MARPIAYTQPVRDVREELRVKLEAAPLKHAEAVLAGFEVLQELHDRGVLDTLRGALGAGDDIIETLVEAGKTPEAVRGLRNLIVLSKSLGTVDPEMLSGFSKSLTDALDKMKSESAEPPGFLGLFRHFRRKDHRRGVVFVNNFLEALGRNLRKPG